jgi:predicted nucleic acid-binding protein
MDFLEKNLLMGRGLGLIDLHLIASAYLSGIPLWTLDKKLRQASSKLGIAY